MKRFIITIASLLGVVTILTLLGSCKKYPDNKGIHLSSAKNRIEGQWKIDAPNTLNTWQFNSSGTGWHNYKLPSNTFTWELINGKEDIRITLGSNTWVCHITQLTKKELSWQYPNTGLQHFVR